MKYRIFIVEDDETIANLLKKHLSSWGYEVFLAEDFSNVLQEFAGKDPQLVLLDLKLPFYNGFHWCEEIRKVSQVPVIFISSAADNMNMVMAMSRGADDFIAKPFDMDVLVAKIQAILRRTYSFGNPGNILEHKGAVLNLSGATLTWNGMELELTRNELRILELLFYKNISPTHLLAVVKLIEQMWRQDKQNRNALAIAEEAGKMLNKFSAFLEDMARIEKSVGQAGETLREAMRKLSTGTGSLVSRAQKIEQLGAKAKKSLPQRFIDDGDEETE